MTRVLVAPDKFKGSLTAAEVADALAEGLAAGNPSFDITCAPVADGGDGTVAAAAREAHFQLACDVDNPLLGANGAPAIYAPQKGAAAKQLVDLEAMTRWAQLVRTATGHDYSHTAGAGAAGGTAFGAMSVLGARTRPGIDTVLALIDFGRRLAGADLVVTGEGSLDVQSLHGKAPIGVAAAAGEAGVPVVAVAGRCVLSDIQLRSAGIRMAYTLAELEPDIHKSMANAAELLRRIGRTIATASTDFVTTTHQGES